MSDLCPVVVSRKNMNTDQPNTASEALLSFMKSNRLCDVTFTFENSPERIEAHQLCLRARSPVFDSMLCGRGSVSAMVQLKVENVQPAVFQKFLEFIYSDKLDVTPIEALHLHQLGQKYKVQPLMKKCEALLHEKIPIEQAVDIYETAQNYRNFFVKKEAEGVIVRSLEDLLQGQQLLTAKEATLAELLVRDDLRVREVDLFKFIVRWGQEAAINNDQLPQVLAGLLPKIRFTNMTAEEFTTAVMPTKLIPSDEAVDIYAYFTGNNSTKTALISKLKYSMCCRCGELEEILDFYETGPATGDDDREKPSWYEGDLALGECMSFKVRGATEMSRSCPDFNKKAQARLQLTSIQIQWPEYLAGEVDLYVVDVFIMKKTATDREFQYVCGSSEYNVPVGCLTDYFIYPAVEICDEAEYCIEIYDNEELHREPYPSTYRYSSDKSPCGPTPKSSVVGGCFKNVEIYDIRRNDCPDFYGSSPEYDGIHVIRGVQLEFTHEDPDDEMNHHAEMKAPEV